MQKLLAMLAGALVGALGDYLKKNPEILDRAVDRLGDRLTEKLPDLSDLDDQIVAKLPDLSDLPKQVGDVLTATLGAIPSTMTGINDAISASIQAGFDILGVRNNKGLGK